MNNRSEKASVWSIAETPLKKSDESEPNISQTFLFYVYFSVFYRLLNGQILIVLQF